MAGALKVDTIQNGSGGTFDWAASGATTFPAGTALLPGITTTGDTNTGIFFPAADTIAFSEGGAEAMRIDSSGNVGIGTASPSQKLQIAGSQLLSNPGSSVYTYFDGVSAAYVGREAVAGAMVFGVNSAERMRIDSAGNLLFNSGYGSVATAYGCRAWVNFNGTGAVAIRASGNVSSITDRGVGLYSVNLTVAMPDVNYATGGFHKSDTDYSAITGQPHTAVAPDQTTSAFPIKIASSGAYYDSTLISAFAFR